GNVLARGAYRAGLKDGPWTYFHDAKDRVLVEAAYTAGRRSGLWRAFDAEGRPWMELRHVPGEVEPRAFLAPTGPEGLENMASTPPHSVVTGPGSFPGAWLLPHGTPEREVTQETFIRVFHPNGKVQSEGTWKGRRPVGVHRTWSEDGHEVEVVDRDAGTRRAAAGPGKAREERTREVDAKSFLTRRWDERGRLVWLARTGEDDALQGRVTVWDGNGQPRAYLNGARGILQGAFRLPGSEGQPDLTGRALYGEVIEIQPDPCPPGSRLDIRLREELRLDCELPDGPAVLRGEWSADLTPSGWVKDPNGHQAEDAKRAAGARGSRQGESDEVSRYPDGRPRWEKVTEADGHQRYRAWYPDGTLREEGRYREGAPDGLWRGFAPNGTPVWEGRFDGGNRVGVWQAWYEDGTRRSRHGFGAWRFARFWRRDGSLWKEAEESPREQLDLWRWYSPGGKLQVEGTMRKGAPIGPWRLDLDGDGVFESRELPDGKRLQWRVSGADGQSTLEVVTQGEGATGTWRLTDAQGPRDVSLRREGEVQKRWTRDAKGVLVAVPQRAPEPEEHASEPPPWKARVDDEAPPFLPEELAAEAATP
ncbi:MAG TPA: hypothetical protein VE153_34140, partial [Myxococcus sp.]|nr:hypothetical protein [Myxococcus sp.]